jgi:hypothetical protein
MRPKDRIISVLSVAKANNQLFLSHTLLWEACVPAGHNFAGRFTGHNLEVGFEGPSPRRGERT